MCVWCGGVLACARVSLRGLLQEHLYGAEPPQSHHIINILSLLMSTRQQPLSS